MHTGCSLKASYSPSSCMLSNDVRKSKLNKTFLQSQGLGGISNRIFSLHFRQLSYLISHDQSHAVPVSPSTVALDQVFFFFLHEPQGLPYIMKISRAGVMSGHIDRHEELSFGGFCWSYMLVQPL